MKNLFKKGIEKISQKKSPKGLKSRQKKKLN
jgi:hypothetical protein